MADSVAASIYVEAPCERVFEYFVRPEALVRWMGEYAVLEPEPNGRFQLDIRGTPVRGRYLALEPPHRLLISWGYAGSELLPPGASTVEIRLTPDGQGTRVELEHRDLPGGERRPHVVGWEHYLTRFHRALAAGDAGPDPGMPTGASADSTPVRGRRVPS